MSPDELSRSILFCEQLSLRFATYLRVNGYDKDHFDSLEQFERFESNPSLARAEKLAAPVRKHNSGIVYLAKGNDSYKIGRSSNFKVREHQLTVKLPFPVKVIHTILAGDSVAVERFWHERFAQQHIRGEWFSLSDSDVAEFIQHAEM